MMHAKDHYAKDLCDNFDCVHISASALWIDPQIEPSQVRSWLRRFRDRYASSSQRRGCRITLLLRECAAFQSSMHSMMI
jgi:acetyl-CoA carboxylase carboxyltransferase component